MSGCAMCGGPLPPSKPHGHRRKFCSERCRKRQYDKTCIDCGGRVDGTTPGRDPGLRCASCSRKHQHDTRYWTPERIVAAIERWTSEHGGVPPTAKTWNNAARRPSWAPYVATVIHEFGTWNAGLRAAGYEPHMRRTRWTDDEMLNAIRSWVAEHGTPPTIAAWGCAFDDRWPVANTVILRFGSWNAAIRAAGFMPRSHGRPRLAVAA